MWIIKLFSWEFIDVIKWENPEEFLLVKKFDRPLDQIKGESTLIVEPWYSAVFVHNGKVEAIQTTPWKWSLDTDNFPFITSLKNIIRWVESPHKSSIYFIKTTEITNQKWSTKNPIKYIDPTYKIPINLEAFWDFTFKVSDIEVFWINYVGTRSKVKIDEIKDILVDKMSQFISDAFAESAFTYTDIDKNRDKIADKVLEKVNDNIWSIWVKISDFRIEDTKFTEDTEKLISNISEQSTNVNSINQIKDSNKKALENYTPIKQIDVIEKDTQNNWWVWEKEPIKDQAINNNQELDQEKNIEFKLSKLKDLLGKKLITKEEYEWKKKEILRSL